MKQHIYISFVLSMYTNVSSHVTKIYDFNLNNYKLQIAKNRAFLLLSVLNALIICDLFLKSWLVYRATNTIKSITNWRFKKQLMNTYQINTLREKKQAVCTKFKF